MLLIRVILADDHATMRATIRKYLDNAPGIEVVGEASNGVETLRLIEELVPDVLLLDIEMPRMTGIEVARQLQAARSPVRILALSAYDDWPYIQGLLDTGAAGYLTKSEVPELIIEAVRGVARDEQGWIGRQVARQISTWSLDSRRQPIQIPLTGREKAVLRLLAGGKTNHEIERALNLSKKLVETYLETALAKLGVTSQAAAIKRAVQERLI
jgi:DNA-binding NarL/FixJ family response regulator